ncbi:hypothetical protein RUMHYD_01504 [Blautia hydrogenotrophica DSM 10507]|uniref:Uncharacterized protein n=1 Tax=Blautia hydrogenotrophica (strain DSM 10507 / JCM 14656 / S5a33) TaxID=476272 RepID=C0CKY5_BLAHS|nr:hypothetical protein RUMHYD_01504 [Blautia hydrogenotrophica DSM 10507]
MLGIFLISSKYPLECFLLYKETTAAIENFYVCCGLSKFMN